MTFVRTIFMERRLRGGGASPPHTPPQGQNCSAVQYCLSSALRAIPGRAGWYESLQKNEVGKTGLQRIFVCQRASHCCKKSVVHIATPVNVKMAVTNTIAVGMFLLNNCVEWWGGCAPPHPPPRSKTAVFFCWLHFMRIFVF